jgi:signal transduction histidine kinase
LKCAVRFLKDGASTFPHLGGEPMGAQLTARASQPIHLAGAILGGQRHVCGFFDGPEDEHRTTLPFVQEGLERKELAFHIVDPAERDNYARRLEQDGIRVAELERSGGFELRTWPDTYLRGGKFDPAAMLALLEEVVQRRAPRFPLVRFVAHMNFPNADQKTWYEWIAYEARLNQVLAKYPDPLLCAYETRQYNGAVVLDVQRAHPAVIIGGSLQSNPFFKAFDGSLRGRERVAARAETAAGPPKRRQAIEARKQKQSLELRERALAVVSHDLRNPLSAILTGAFALRQEAGLSVEGVGIAGRIVASAKRMDRIIGDLIELTNVRGMELTQGPVDAHELCARIVEELHAGWPDREIRLRIEGNGSGRWDADRLERAVSNLAANALQYGQQGTPVTIESRGGEEQWTLSVHNLGEPIPPDVRRRLFEPFRRVRRAKRSRLGRHHLGIGLFIAREVVLAHRGSIEVTSTLAEGTRFVVHLPKR